MSLERVQSSVTRGHAAKWTVGAWTKNGNVPDATVSLKVAPTGQKATFSFGCGSSDGTASCDLGAVDSASVPRQLQAQVTVPATATSVKSVELTAIANAANVAKKPQVSDTVTVTTPAPPPSASPSPSGAGTSTNTNTNTNVNANIGISTPPPTPLVPAGNVTSPLSIANLPYLNGTGSSLSPGGNASGLFPTLNPSGTLGTGLNSQSTIQAVKARTRPVADTSALPQGTSVIGAQLAGLIALALAFVLAVTRLSIRKRPAPAAASGVTAAAPGAAAPGAAAAEPDNAPGNDPKQP